MISGAVIGILVALSAATWAYTKAMRQTGNNTKSAAIVAGITGFVSFVVVLTVVSMVNSSL